MDETLLILGGGPKAAAVTAKCRILRELGLAAPRTIVLEQSALGAAWSGKFGFTTGDLRLGTPPEKDIGFPYFADPQNPRVTEELFRRFSWLSYLAIQKFELGEWIDRGRPHPTHEEWSKYLSWVLRNSANGEHGEIVYGKVLELHAEAGRWRVVAFCENKRVEIRGEQLLITGTGEAKRPPFDVPANPNIVHGDDFWNKVSLLRDIETGEDALPIVIVGGGETAASIAAYLVDRFGSTKPVKIVIVTRRGTIYTRGEGYYENRIFTHHDGWHDFDEEIRLEVILRGDRGVFSAGVVDKLAHAPNVEHRFLAVRKVETLNTTTNSISINGHFPCQFLIFAMGFDPLSFARIMISDKKITQALTKKIKIAPGKKIFDIERKIEYDLSVGGGCVPAKLYLPALAGLAQGPGFPNLSCLGLLSDRILKRVKHSSAEGP